MGIPDEWLEDFCDWDDRRERAQPESEIPDNPWTVDAASKTLKSSLANGVFWKRERELEVGHPTLFVYWLVLSQKVLPVAVIAPLSWNGVNCFPISWWRRDFESRFPLVTGIVDRGL